MRFVQRVADNRPVLISGDFNAEPIEPVYSTVINYTPLGLSSAYADLLASLSTNQNGDECDGENGANKTTGVDGKNVVDGHVQSDSGNDAGNDEIVENDVKNPVDHLISHEPPYTTWKIREDGEVCHTIDYVFYSRDKFKVSCRINDSIFPAFNWIFLFFSKVNNCLRFPLGNEIGKNRTPSDRYPSDHFSLLCDFEILDADGEGGNDDSNGDSSNGGELITNGSSKNWSIRND